MCLMIGCGHLRKCLSQCMCNCVYTKLALWLEFVSSPLKQQFGFQHDRVGQLENIINLHCIASFMHMWCNYPGMLYSAAHTTNTVICVRARSTDAPFVISLTSYHGSSLFSLSLSADQVRTFQSKREPLKRRVCWQETPTLRWLLWPQSKCWKGVWRKF